MAPEFLSICIPTRNRVKYLTSLLATLSDQIQQANLGPETVQIHIFDNASTDSTAEEAKAFAARLPHLTYFRNQENIGADRNVLLCAEHGQGRFRWIVGDDEIINPGALVHVLETLKDPELGLMINLDSNYLTRLQRPQRFASFRDFATACSRQNPHILVEHSLITSNVFRKAIFDGPFSRSFLHTSFVHMYGMVHGLIQNGGSIHLSGFPAITVRDRRAPAVDGDWPDHMDQKWLNYLSWLKQELNLADLRPEAALEHVREALWRKIKANPFRYVWNNLPALKQPRAYKWFLRRVLFLARLRK